MIKDCKYDIDINIVISKLEDCRIFNCLKKNHLEAKGDKCHVFVTIDKQGDPNSPF